MRFRLEQTLVRAHHQKPGAEGKDGLPSDDTLALTYNSSGDTLCFGGLAGDIHVWSTGEPHKELFRLTPAMGNGKALTSAVASMAFLPHVATNQRGMLIAACTNGNVSMWHMGAQKCVHTVNEMAFHADHLQPTEVPNQTSIVAVATVGGRFATGGKDGVVRVYDDQTCAVTDLLTHGHVDGIARAHKLAVTGAKWVDANTLVTGGWDDALQVWDVRAGRSVRVIHGPQLAGDSLDVHPDGRTIVTGSSRSKQQLQFWDMGTGECVADVPWPHEPRSEAPDVVDFTATTCLAAKFSADGRYVAAGGDHDFRVFETAMLLDGRYGNAVVGELFAGGGSKRAVYGVAWAPNGEHVALCGGETTVMKHNRGV